MKLRRNILLSSLGLLLPLTSCGNNKPSEPTTYFEYEDIGFIDKIGSKTNDEYQNYDSIKVNPVTGVLRDDFAFGVDASMVYEVEKAGGVYYNQEGKEQDVFQILRKAGVNFVRFRVWVRPSDKLGTHKYGGGNNDARIDLSLATRAKAANMNVMLDFHYSDFWADPEHQNVPMEWASLDNNQIVEKIESYTKETLEIFNDQGIAVDAVQIGNETNNGLAGYKISWTNADASFDQMANMFKAGIKGAKDVFPNIKTIIHLANGGNTEEFKSYFGHLKNRGVDYDIIGASYYPHLSGTLDELKENLDSVSELTGKPVMVVETSWGYTDDYVARTENGTGEYVTYAKNQQMHDTDYQISGNSYSSADEDVGGYLTSVQAQATELRDIVDVLSNVKDNKGLGIFYWEPAWLPVGKASTDKTGKVYFDGAGWATDYGQSYQTYGDYNHTASFTNGRPTWSNQGLFSYTGKALPSLMTYSYLKNGKNVSTEKSIAARHQNLNVTINLASDETLPSVGKVVTDFDAIRNAPIVWSNEAIEEAKVKGKHYGLTGVLDGKYNITATVNSIENHIIDPGFENQGTDDSLKDPWKIDSLTPAGQKIVKLDRKKDTRNGRTDLNWFYDVSDYSFTFSQTVKSLPAASYSLTTYVLTADQSEGKATEFYLFYQIGNGEVVEIDCLELINKGWSAGYQTLNIPEITLTNESSLRVGLRAKCEVNFWGHNDDWELVTIE